MVKRASRRETVNDALLRYSCSLERMLSRGEHVTLVVLHEFALRRIVEAAMGLPSPTEGFANAVPYFLDERAVGRAAAVLKSMARSSA